MYPKFFTIIFIVFLISSCSDYSDGNGISGKGESKDASDAHSTAGHVAKIDYKSYNNDKLMKVYSNWGNDVKKIKDQITSENNDLQNLNKSIGDGSDEEKIAQADKELSMAEHIISLQVKVIQITSESEPVLDEIIARKIYSVKKDDFYQYLKEQNNQLAAMTASIDKMRGAFSDMKNASRGNGNYAVDSQVLALLYAAAETDGKVVDNAISKLRSDQASEREVLLQVKSAYEELKNYARY